MKSNKTNLYTCVYYLSGAGYQQLCFYPRQYNFIPKIFYTFGQCAITKSPYNWGYFTFQKNPPWLPEGECVPLSPTTQISTSRPLPLITQNFHPKYPKIIRKSLRRTFEKSFISNNFQLPKNTPIPSNHPKIPPKNHKIPNKINSFSNKNQ